MVRSHAELAAYARNRSTRPDDQLGADSDQVGARIDDERIREEGILMEGSFVQLLRS